MAQLNHQSKISGEDVPLISSDLSRTIMLGSNSANSVAKEPQVSYMHNMMPTREGMISIGYTTVIPAAGTGFTDVVIIYGNLRTRLHLAVANTGAMYVLKPASTTWLPIPFFRDVSNLLLTVGTVNGISYVYFQGLGCYRYDENADLLVSVVLTAIDESLIVGVTASSGYLIAYTINALAWSSTIAPTDFTPSSVTGAGGGAVADINGAIVFCAPNSLGFVVYSAANAVAVTFTGNVQFPFKFREVTNSKGTLNQDLVTYEANTKEHFVFSKAGLQAIDAQNAVTFLPEVTDFLAGKQLEDFDEATRTFSITNLSNTMLKKVKFIASRYLMISYGITEFTHAIIYDVVLEQAGKLKQTHIDAFEYIGEQQEIAKSTIALLTTTGEVKLVSFSPATDSSGALVLGRYQYAYNRTVQPAIVNIASVERASSLTCSALASLDGHNIDTVYEGFVFETNDQSRIFSFHFQATNFLLALIGKMDLNSLLLKFTVGGKY